ncbi:radical SAM protein [Photobacterium sanctipauli]|uniref:Radical SAM protein n=1 Tax=Photobacterium sanctipauli TaxID=1342794 RepID=A0A2T3NNV7_9GAMM|nr:radical SAM protein [Photobacterium sanctipauli]PSW17671.1 radical SAM protein [Photobacterium sanctipauli]
MKIALIKASHDSDFKQYKKYQASPPQNIFSAAAALSGIAEIAMYDETSYHKAPVDLDCEMAVIFMSTPDALRGYQLADLYRRQGKTVILGGLHATFMTEEALEHADAVMKGESEALWQGMLDDYKRGKLSSVYQADSPFDLANIGHYPTEFIRPEIYQGIWSVTVSRGCRFKCRYCTVPRFFREQTYRPIGDIVDEIKRSGQRSFELKADNLTSDRDYCLELFEALAPLNIYWTAETNLRFADDEELLEAAAESGLWYLLVGLETPSKAGLKEAAKGFNNVHRSAEYIRKLHEYNIVVDSCMIFGFDEHDRGIFDETWSFIHDVKLDVCHPTIMIPFPGTPLYQDLEQQGRILTKDWSKYDGNNAVYQPAKMSVEALEAGCYDFTSRYFSMGEMIKRKASHTKRFGASMALSLP